MQNSGQESDLLGKLGKHGRINVPWANRVSRCKVVSTDSAIGQMVANLGNILTCHGTINSLMVMSAMILIMRHTYHLWQSSCCITSPSQKTTSPICMQNGLQVATGTHSRDVKLLKTWPGGQGVTSQPVPTCKQVSDKLSEVHRPSSPYQSASLQQMQKQLLTYNQ